MIYCHVFVIIICGVNVRVSVVKLGTECEGECVCECVVNERVIVFVNVRVYVVECESECEDEWV